MTAVPSWSSEFCTDVRAPWMEARSLTERAARAEAARRGWARSMNLILVDC